MVPVISVLSGAGLTYLLNVRARKTTAIEDLFEQAIAAVAVAEASRRYNPEVAEQAELSKEEHSLLVVTIIKAAIENYYTKTREAQEAVARVLQYEPRVKQYYMEPYTITHHTDELIELLRSGQSRARSRRRGHRHSLGARVRPHDPSSG